MQHVKGTIIRPHAVGDEFTPHMRQVMITAMGDQYTHIDACSRLKDTVVYLKEHNCAIIGWIALGPVGPNFTCEVIGAGAIQPGRLRDEISFHAAKMHGAKVLHWKVKNPVHNFITAQIGFAFDGDAIAYKLP